MWHYVGRPFFEDEIPQNCVGFVYLIKRLDNGRVYIGQKKFTKARTRKPLKGKSRKRRDRVTSDWQSYYGSNDDLLQDVKTFGEENFHREILHLCFSKGQMNYQELYEQMCRDVLLWPHKYYNSYVGGRISRVHLKNLLRGS